MYETKLNDGLPGTPDDLERWHWEQHINRYWMKYLPPSEYMVLMFILDRTLGWSKRAEIITRRHMLKGVASNGIRFHLGVSLSASTIDTTLNRLVERGAIFRRHVMRGTTTYVEFEINFWWEPKATRKRRRGIRRSFGTTAPRNMGSATPKSVNR